MKKKAIILACVLAALFIGCGSKEAKKTVASKEDLYGAVIGVQLGTIGDLYADDYDVEGAGTQKVQYTKITDAIKF